jgi:hypothetical protein
MFRRVLAFFSQCTNENISLERYILSRASASVAARQFTANGCHGTTLSTILLAIYLVCFFSSCQIVHASER